MDKFEKKYELIQDLNTLYTNRKVYRVKALRDFGKVRKGDIGGFIEGEHNLSHEGDCWIDGDAYVVDQAKVYEDAYICQKAWVFDNALIYGKAIIRGEAAIYHHARVYGNAKVYDYGRVYNSAHVFKEAIIHGNARIKGSMKVTKPVTVIDNNEVIITVTEDKVHVYQSTIYTKDDLPEIYNRILIATKRINREDID